MSRNIDALLYAQCAYSMLYGEAINADPRREEIEMGGETKFGRSSSGLIHRRLGPNATSCSSGNRGLQNTGNFPQASFSDNSFCKKCFPCGNPLKASDFDAELADAQRLTGTPDGY